MATRKKERNRGPKRGRVYLVYGRLPRNVTVSDTPRGVGNHSTRRGGKKRREKQDKTYLWVVLGGGGCVVWFFGVFCVFFFWVVGKSGCTETPHPGLLKALRDQLALAEGGPDSQAMD